MQLVEYDKKFLTIGNIDVVAYKDIFYICIPKSNIESKWNEDVKKRFYLLKSELLRTSERRLLKTKKIICFLRAKMEAIRVALPTKNKNIIPAYVEQKLKEKITLVGEQSEVDYVNKLYNPEE